MILQGSFYRAKSFLVNFRYLNRITSFGPLGTTGVTMSDETRAALVEHTSFQGTWDIFAVTVKELLALGGDGVAYITPNEEARLSYMGFESLPFSVAQTALTSLLGSGQTLAIDLQTIVCQTPESRLHMVVKEGAATVTLAKPSDTVSSTDLFLVGRRRYEP